MRIFIDTIYIYAFLFMKDHYFYVELIYQLTNIGRRMTFVVLILSFKLII